uniref:GDNF/GAS1 domain-containing protein n=1 Tax=Lepeophtheirus salmonis TaxID=72036 RepID=A0A0K2TY70_LEPSM
MRLGEPWQEPTCKYVLFFNYFLLLCLSYPSTIRTSESPERDCCEPIYPFLTPNPSEFFTSKSPSDKDYPEPTLYPEYPPEIPDNIITLRNNIRKKQETEKNQNNKKQIKPLRTTTTSLVSRGPTTTTRTSTAITRIPTTTTKPPKKDPDKGIVFTVKPTSGSLNCLLARQLCSEDSACSQILEIIPKVCGIELVACSTVTVTKCQAAIRTLQGFPFFSPTCLCEDPHLDQKCNLFRRFLFYHPCGVVKTKEEDPYPIDALPTCTHAYNVCQHSKPCIHIFNDFQESCTMDSNSKCTMKSWNSCQSAWSKLHLSPMFGCICPNNFHQKVRCDEIFNAVNNNTCIDVRSFTNSIELIKFWSFWYSNRPYTTHRIALPETSPTTGVSFQTISHQHVEEGSLSTPVYSQENNPIYGPQDGSADSDIKVQQLQSTCHLALNSCEQNNICNRYLDKLKRSCDSTLTCDKNECMLAIQRFYKNIPRKFKLDVAFCLCKNTPNTDEHCLRAQAILHPTCAQTPTSEKQPACHEVTRACQSNTDCSKRLERYDQACSVDGPTRACAGPPNACRRAMINILGTELRTNCNCEGTADFRELYECIGWHRLLWVNPCVVEAQKNFHKFAESLDGSDHNMVSSSTIFDRTAIPYYTTVSYFNTPEFRATTSSPYSDFFDLDYQSTSGIITPTPMQPTSPPVYPTPPWPRRYTTRKTIYRVTTTTTTTTTLPPKFCLLERPGQPVKYIREGYKKRLYKFDDPECSELCECSEGEELLCKVLDCIKRDACNTGVAFYSHASPFYQAYRGQCLCYSGSFVCSKPPKEVELVLPRGVYLFMGFSSKDESILKKITGSGATDAIGAIQGLVSYHNVNSNKSECRMILQKHSVENLVLQAVMDEFEDNREKKNLTAEILHREKEECFEALEAISYKINNNDADMRSHVILSMIKVASAEADIPDLPVSNNANSSFLRGSGIKSSLVFSNIALVLFIHLINLQLLNPFLTQCIVFFSLS